MSIDLVDMVLTATQRRSPVNFSAPTPPPAPKPPEPVYIPSPDDPAILAAKREKAFDLMHNREGRESTFLAPKESDSAEPFTRTALG